MYHHCMLFCLDAHRRVFTATVIYTNPKFTLHTQPPLTCTHRQTHTPAGPRAGHTHTPCYSGGSPHPPARCSSPTTQARTRMQKQRESRAQGLPPRNSISGGSVPLSLWLGVSLSLFFPFLSIFMATSGAYGGSQARVKSEL